MEKTCKGPSKESRGRPRKTIGETIKRDLNVNDLNVNMIYDRTLTSFDPCSRPHLVGQGLVVVGNSSLLL